MCYYCEGVKVLDELAEDILFCGEISPESRIELLVNVIVQLIDYGWDRKNCSRDTVFAGDPLLEEAYERALTA